MIQQMYTIKEAAKELGVEAHALRYWEEELELTIERNAQGRRIYTKEDVQRFKDVMVWKDQGLQLKSIRALIHGENQMINQGQLETKVADMSRSDRPLSGSRDELAGHRIIVYRPKEMNSSAPAESDATELDKAEKSRRLQELLKQFISESIRESNAELLQVMKEGLLKELDYQFRLQEEREEEREKVRIEKEDEHFRRLDENLRSAMEKRGRKKKRLLGK